MTAKKAVAKKKAAKRGSATANAPATPAPVQFTQVNDELLRLDPAVVTLGANARFGLLRSRIETLKADVLASGGIRTPVEVVELTADERAMFPGKSYKILTGNYRFTVAEELNREQHAGILLPAMLRPQVDEIGRIRRQAAENNQRQDMTLMDCATTIDQAFAAGMPRAEVRMLFPVISGGKTKPRSNAWINMVHNFLKFPQGIRNKIHDGRVGVLAAYELYKKPKDQWENIVKLIEEKREKAEKAEDREEASFLKREAKEAKAQQKLQEVKNKAAEVDKAVADAQALYEQTKAATDTAIAAASAAYTAAAQATAADKETQKRLSDDFKSKEAASDQAKKALKKVETDLAKAKQVQAKQREIEKEVKTPTPAPAQTPISAPEVHRAASDLGASEHVPLKLNEAKECVRTLTLQDANKHKKSILAGRAILDSFEGKVTDGQLQQLVNYLFGTETKLAKPVADYLKSIGG